MPTGPFRAYADGVSNLHQMVVELRNQVASLETKSRDSWEAVEDLLHLRRDIEELRQFRDEAKKHPGSSESVVPRSGDPSSRMNALTDADDAKRRCLDGADPTIP